MKVSSSGIHACVGALSSAALKRYVFAKEISSVVIKQAKPFENRQPKETAPPHFKFLYFMQKIHAQQNKQEEWRKRDFFEMRDQTKEQACSAGVL